MTDEGVPQPHQLCIGCVLRVVGDVASAMRAELGRRRRGKTLSLALFFSLLPAASLRPEGAGCSAAFVVHRARSRALSGVLVASLAVPGPAYLIGIAKAITRAFWFLGGVS